MSKKVCVVTICASVLMAGLFGAAADVLSHHLAATTVQDVPRFDENALKQVAEEEEYGYKYANLDRLREVVTFLNDSVLTSDLPRVGVPEFI